MNYGYVYCLYNDNMPNLCKIGCVNTLNKTSQDRAKELSSSTSCPLPFKVFLDIKVKNPFKYEKILHTKLNKFREFFKCNPSDIINYFKMGNLISSKNDESDFHENYLQIKLNTKLDIKEYICKLCNYNYASRQSLWKHTKKFHTNFVVLPQYSSCTYCKKIFLRKDSIKRHLLICKIKLSNDTKLLKNQLEEQKTLNYNMKEQLIKDIQEQLLQFVK